MHLQTKAIIITAIGICSLFFLSSVEAKASSYSLASPKQASNIRFSDVSHRYNDKRYIRASPKRHKSSSRHKREKIGALLGGVLIGTAIASHSRDARSSYSPRHPDRYSYDKYHKHTRQCRHRDTYRGQSRRHSDKNYTGYRGYRDNHRQDRHHRHSDKYSGNHYNNHHYHNDRKSHSSHGRHSGSKTYAPNYELRRDHNNRLSCYRVKMYRKGEKVLERVDRDYCGW